jgi:hypothetical protein
MEGTEFPLGRFLGIDPTRGFVFEDIGAPDGFGPAHDVGGPGEPFSGIDLGSVWEDVVLDADLEVARDRGEDSEGYFCMSGDEKEGK